MLGDYLQRHLRGFPFGLPVILRAICSGFYGAPVGSFGVSVGAGLGGFWGSFLFFGALGGLLLLVLVSGSILLLDAQGV